MTLWEMIAWAVESAYKYGAVPVEVREIVAELSDDHSTLEWTAYNGQGFLPLGTVKLR